MSCWCSCCTCQGRSPPTLRSQSSSSLSLRLWFFLLRKLILGWKRHVNKAMYEVPTTLAWLYIQCMSPINKKKSRCWPEWLRQSFPPFPPDQVGEPGHTWRNPFVFMGEHEHWWKYIPFCCKLSSGECLLFNFKLFLLSCNDLSRMEIASTVFQKRIV